MIEMVTLAEARLADEPQVGVRRGAIAAAYRAAGRGRAIPSRRDQPLPDGATEGAWRRPVLEFRGSGAVLNFVNGKDVARYANAGVITPDHTIRTKDWPLIVAAPVDGALDDFKRAAIAAVEQYVARYRAYFERNNARLGNTRTMLDPLPRVALVPGLGLFGLGRHQEGRHRRRGPCRERRRSHHRCRSHRHVSNRSAKPTCSTANTGRWSAPSSAARSELPLAGQIAVVTGAGGTIGAATAKAFAGAGAEVALLDVDDSRRNRKSQGHRQQRARGDLRRHRRGVGARGVRQGRRGIRRRRYRSLQRRRGLAGPHRRGRRGGAAAKLRAQFLRPPARRAERGAHHAGAGHRRLPPVQRVEAGGQSGAELRTLWIAQGRDHAAGAAIRGRLRRRRHPLQRRQRRSHPLGPSHRTIS